MSSRIEKTEISISIGATIELSGGSPTKITFNVGAGYKHEKYDLERAGLITYWLLGLNADGTKDVITQFYNPFTMPIGAAIKAIERLN